MASAVNAFQLENGTDIARRREQVLSQYKAFKESLVSRRAELNSILRLQHFYRDADELERWIADRMQRAVDHSWSNSTNLEVFMQKHRALEAEVLANRESLVKLDNEGGEMVANQHTAKEAIEIRLADLHHQWDELVKALELRGVRLNQARKLVTFIGSCDEVLYWIKDKEAVACSTELGADLDHVNLLRAKYDEFANELQGFGERVKDVNENADEMINRDEHPEVAAIQGKQKEMNDAWSRINEQAQARLRALVASTEVHKFKREVEETMSWMKEKELMLHSDDLGTDVASVQKLQRRHDNVERDMAALNEKVEELCAEADRIEKEHDGISLEDERNKMLKSWEQVTKFASQRKNVLQQRYDLQRFLAESQDLLDWSADIEVRMSTDDVAPDVAGAEALLDKHQEHRGEIGAHEGTFADVMSFGKDLIAQNHPAAADVALEEEEELSSSSSSSSSDEDEKESVARTKPGLVPERVSTLEGTHIGLLQLWEDRQALYDQCLHLALFNRDAEQAETWMTAQEALLLHNDLGDSLDSVQTLKRKHDDFMKSADAQEEKINSVNEVASRLVERSHYASEDIEKRRDQIMKRHAAMKEAIRARHVALDDAYKLYSFRRNAANLSSWIEEKRAVACDQSHKDPSNARGKLQRHRVFEEEVRASEERVRSCVDEAQSLVKAEHYAANEIEAEADRVQELWKKLGLECKDRGNRLTDSCAEQAFARGVMDVQRWMDEVEATLASDDRGKDVASVTALIKKHQLLEVDVQVHKDRVEGIEIQANKFIDAGHFNSDAIKQRQEEVTERYAGLQEPMSERREKLLTSLHSKQLFRDVADELEWIEDKRPIAAATTTGKDLISVRNLLRKHQIVQSELHTHEGAVEAVVGRCNKLVEEGHFEARRADSLLNELTKEWKRLRSDADLREKNLNDALEAHKYLSNANDANQWMAEKRSILSSSDVGVDEDSAESLLKKHEALTRDVDSFSETVEALHGQAEAAKLQCPWEKENALERVVVVHEYREKTPRELSVRKGDVLSLVSAYNKDWWKVEGKDRRGFVPSSCITIITDEDAGSSDSSDSDEDVVDSAKPQPTLLSKQVGVEESYAEVKQLCAARHAILEHSRRRHALARECAHLRRWMDERRSAAELQRAEEERGGLEEVEKLQKKLDDFQKDLKAREKRVSELNNELRMLDLDEGSSSDSSDGEGSSEDVVVARNVKNLNEEWEALHQVVARQADMLGSAHQVQRFFRDADEVRDWLDEKSEALNNDNIGSDLPTVQALQRKHEGLERDLAALGERVHSLDADGSRLTEQHQEQEEVIQAKQTEINQAWNDLVAKAEARKISLSRSRDLQQFLANCAELRHWLRHMSEQVSSDDVADSIPGVESLLQLHQEHRADMDARSPSFHALERQADALVQAEHPSAPRIDAAIQELSRDREELEKSWATRRILLEQCLALLLFLRDCDNAELWMQAREAFVASEESGDSLDSVESLIKKHEDFDRAIGLQEAKMAALQASAQQLMTSDPCHYANDAIGDKAEQVQDRWQKLKVALIEKRSRLGETQTLQQFSRDADEADAWIAEKLETAMDENYKDPANIQNVEHGMSKHQKHQAFEAEVEANRERIHAIMQVGQQLIDSHQCAGSEEAVKERIEKLQEEWNNLLNKTLEKGSKLKEANQQQNFITAVKDLELWMSEVEAVLASEDVGKDVRSVANLLKKQKLLEADVAAHEDRARDLARHAATLLEKADGSDALDRDTVEEKRDAIERRFANIRELSRQRRAKLQESQVIQQLLSDIADEESWITEKKLLVGSDDVGRDLTSVHNLMKKQKRIEAEIASHEANIERIMASGEDVLSSATMFRDEITSRMAQLDENWKSLRATSDGRSIQLSQAQAFQRFRADLEEEASWASEQLALLDSNVPPDSLAASQSSSSKHEALERDFNVHRARIADVKNSGLSLIEQENPHSGDVRDELARLEERLAKVDTMVTNWRDMLRDTSAFLQFNWKADLVESWIGEKEAVLKVDDHSDDLSVVQALIVKQATFDAGLAAFEQEGIANITALKQQLVEADHAQSAAIAQRHSLLMERWDGLKAASKVRKESLEQSQERLRGINDLYLLFAKKASAFNSWFENVEEDLSDPVRCHSVVEIQALLKEHNTFRTTLGEAKQELNELFSIDDQLEKMNGSVNPYTWFTRQTLEETWASVMRMVDDREAELQRELGRQKDNDAARQRFALEANSFHDWLTSTRASMVEESGTLESQLEATKLKSTEVKDKKSKLKEVEELASALEEALILDNAYTEHSALALAQQWDQLDQLGMRMQHSLEQQIQARNMTGVTEDALKEFSMMFKHFDKDKTGRLEHHEFKSCLRSLGYDLPMVEEGEEDPEFHAILDMVDPNRDGNVSLQEYMGFMISRETENVKSSGEVESAFQALSTEGKPYVTRDELVQNLSREQAEYCIANMPPYYDSHGISVMGAYDYVAFTRELFNN